MYVFAVAEPWINIIVVSCSVGVTALIHGLWRRYHPFIPPADMGADEIESLKVKYAWVDGVGCGLMIVLIFVCIPVWTSLLWSVSLFRNLSMPDYVFISPPEIQPAPYAVPGLMLGIITAGWLTSLILWVQMDKADRHRYERLYDAMQGYNTTRFALIVTAIGVGTSAVAMWMTLDWYARFEEDRICINAFWSVETKTYRYDQVAHIVERPYTYTRDGKEMRAYALYLVFDDGNWWTPSDWDKHARPLVSFVRDRSGKAIEQAESLEEVLRKMKPMHQLDSKPVQQTRKSESV